jgi:hypothetical protein
MRFAHMPGAHAVSNTSAGDRFADAVSDTRASDPSADAVSDTHSSADAVSDTGATADVSDTGANDLSADAVSDTRASDPSADADSDTGATNSVSTRAYAHAGHDGDSQHRKLDGERDRELNIIIIITTIIISVRNNGRVNRIIDRIVYSVAGVSHECVEHGLAVI